MRIILSDTVLSDSVWYPYLDAILLIVEEGRHGFDAPSLHHIVKSKWVKSRPNGTRELIQLSGKKRSYDRYLDACSVTVDAGAPRRGQSNFDSCDTRLHPYDVVRFLSMPFQVLVENEVSDGSFLLWIARAIGFQRFIDAYRRNQFAFRHAGGKSAMLASAEVFSSGVWPRPDKKYYSDFKLWLCAVLDSDSDYPGHAPNAQIAAKLRSRVAFVHVLSNRSIESYIPIEKLRVLQGDPSMKRRVYALSRLNSTQVKHYNMKRGFEYNGARHSSKTAFLGDPSIPLELRNLYRDISDEDWVALAPGFGGGIGFMFAEDRYRPAFGDTDFNNPEHRTELWWLLEEIYKRI
jgi:hypothetical protein